MKNIYNFTFLQALIGRLTLGVIAILSFQFTSAQIDNNDINVTPDPTDLGVCGFNAVAGFEVQAKQGLSNMEFTLTMPTGVTYVTGSVIATSGTKVITEVGPVNTSNPTFSIAGVWTIGETMEFEYERTAGCVAVTYALGGGLFKDGHTVTYSGGTQSPASNLILGQSSYNLIYASLAVLNIAPISGVNVGDTIMGRNVILENGGNGSVSASTFYAIVDPAATGNYELEFGGSVLVPDATSGDTMFYEIDFTAAPWNAAVGGNGAFDLGEFLTFEESFVVQQCNQIPTRYAAYWGCTPGEICQEADSRPAILQFNSTAPNLSISYAPGSSVGLGLCGATTFEFMVINTAPAGSGASAFDLLINTGIGSNSTAVTTHAVNPLDGYANMPGDNRDDVRITSNYTIGGVPATTMLFDKTGDTGPDSTLMMLKDILATNIDGAGGLEDLDGDGFFDDLAAGDTFYFSYDIALDPQDLTCGTGRDDYLEWQHCYTDIAFLDQCGSSRPSARRDVSYENIIRDYLTSVTTTDGPTDVGPAPDTIFTVEVSPKLYLTRASLCDNPSGSTWEVRVPLPAGIIWTGLNVSQFDSLQMDTMFMDGDTLVQRVNGTSTNVNDTLNLFRFNLLLDCDLYTGPSNLTLEYSSRYSCGPCWTQDIHCNVFPTIALHCPSPCRGPVPILLDNRRTTAGWSDNTMTAFVDLDTFPEPMLDVMLARDTFVSEATIWISDTVLPNLWADYFYTTPSASYTEMLDYISATYRTSSGASGNITVPAVLSGAAPSYNVRLDVSESVPVALLQPDDTVWIEAKFYVRDSGYDPDNIEVFNQFRVRPFALAADNITQRSCDTYGDQLSVIKIQPVNTDISVTSASACAAGNLRVNLRVTNNAGDVFPLEFRPTHKIDSAYVMIPEGYEYAGVVSYVQPGAINPSNTLGFDEVYNAATKELILTTNNDFVQPDMVTHVSSSQYLSVAITPVCGVVSGSAPYTSTLGWTEFVYSDFASTNSDDDTESVTYSNPPNFLVQSPNISSDGDQDTISWDVTIANVNTTDYAYNWLRFEENADVTFQTVENILTGATLPFISSNGFTYVEIDTIKPGIDAEIRLFATFSTCNDVTINAAHGWGCTSYPLDYDSVNASSCYTNSVDLLLEPKPSEVQISITDQLPAPFMSDLCDSIVIELAVLSAQIANLTSPVLTLPLPGGAGALDVDTAFIEYPQGSGDIQALIPVISGADLIFNLADHTYIDSIGGIHGLNTNPSPGADFRTANISMQLRPQCNFVANSQLSYSVNGGAPCGDPAVGDGAIVATDALVINGANKEYDIFSSITAPVNGIVGCGIPGTISIVSTVVAPGPNTTGVNDSLNLILPLGLNYVPGSFNCTSADCPTFVSSSIVFGQEVLLFSYPAGVGNLEQFIYDVDVQAIDSLCSESSTLDLNSFVSIAGLACSATACPPVKVETGKSNVVIPFSKPQIAGNVPTSSGSAIYLPGTNAYALTLELTNADSLNTMLAGYSYSVYCADAGGNALGAAIYAGVTTQMVAPLDTIFEMEEFTSTEQCSDIDGLLVEFLPGPGNCLCDASRFVIPLMILDPLVAVDDADSTEVGIPVVINVLANDSANGSTFDTTSLAEVDAPMNGTVSVDTTTGEITYTPDPSFSGLDSFTYVICAQEIAINCDTATVSIYVPNTTTSKDDINSTLIDTPVSGSVMTNDGDPQSDNQLVSSTPVAMPMNGMVTLLPNGNYTYTPNPGFSGQDEFQYEICDDGTPVACDTSTVYITIEPRPIAGNNPPIAEQDIATTEVDVPVTLSLLSNDSEIDGDSIIINTTPLTGPSNGTVVIGTDGSALYTPALGFVGTDTFTYSICDPFGLCDTTEAIITIIPDVGNEVFANDDAGAGLQDMPISGSMIANDSDPEGDVYFVNDLTPIMDVTNGSVVLNNDGTYVYTPDPGYTGPDQFTYELCDNGTPQACDTATVYLTVLPAPNSTEASNDINSTPQDIAVAGNVLTNDTDDEGDMQSVNPTPLSPTTNGTVSLFPNGSYVYTPNPGFTGEDQFTYEVCDDATPQACDTATVFITVVGNPMAGNNPPVANEDEGTTEVDTPVDGSLLSNDSDPDGDSLVVNTTPLTPPSNGGVVINPDGTYTYNPGPGFVGVDTFEYIICDFPGALCDTTLAIITIIEDEGNETFTQDDAGTGLQDQPILGNISANDSDPEGDVQSVNTTPLSGPSNGTVTILPDGSYTYNPNPGFSGNDQFVYNVCDNGTPIACDTATVYLTVLPPFSLPIVAVDDSAIAVTEIPVNINVIANDTADAGFDNTSLAEVVPPMNGMVSYNPDGTVDYTSNPGFFGIDSFDYVICDLLLTCDTATVYVTVTPGPNNPPNAMNDDTTTLEDTPVVIDPLTNDTDLDGPLDSTSVTIVTPPNDAMVTVDPVTGEMTVTPDPNFTGVITYQYEVCDTATPPLCDIATVTVTIIPVPDTVVVSTPEDSTINLCTDTTVNFNDPISGISICGAPMNGTITPSFIPCLDYTPNMDYVGPDTICVVTCAGVFCDTTIFVIDVTPVNDAPVAIDDDTTTLEDTPVIVDVINNDYDLEGPLDSTSVVVTTDPANGTAVPNGDGTITYTPDPNFVGVDMYTYAVCDTGLPVLCDTAVVTITIVSQPDTILVTVPEDGTETICTDTSVNFEDPITSVTLCGAPMNGTTAPAILPCIDYSPVMDYVGPDTMCIVTCSGVYCDTTIVIIDVTPVNDPPTAVDNDTTTLEDTPVTVDVLDNDYDLDGPIDTATVAVVTDPANGTLTNNGDGTITYTPDPNFVGVDEYTYAVCDTGLPVLCDTAVVTITIVSQPDTIYVTVPEDGTETICTDTSVNFADPITSISLCDAPDNGAIAPSTLPCVDYSPAMNYVGPDTMCIVTCSGVFCDTTIVIIDVTPVNDPPVAVDDNATTTEDTPVTIDLVNNDFDIDGPIDSASITITTPPTNGTVTVNGDGTVDYTPDPNFCGVDMFNYSVCDTGLPVLCDEALVTVNIACAPDTTLLTLPEDSMITLCTDSVTNLAGPITSVSLCGAPSNGTLAPTILPCVEYTPNPDYWGPDTTCLITCAGSVCDTTYIFITVTPVIDVPVLDPVEDICETEPIPALTGTSEAGSVIQWIENGVIIGTGSPFTPPAVPGENCYQAVAFNATLGMTSMDTAEVCFTIDSLPTNVNAGPDDTICGFQDYELQATGNGRLVFWTQIVGQQVSLDLGNPNAIAALEPNNNPGTDNIYTFAWTNTNGLCTVSDTVTIWVTNPHFTDAGNDTSICVPEAGGSVQLNATLTPGATGWWNYVGSENIVFVDSTDAQTVVNGLVPYNNTASTYLFEWFEQIADCIAKDEVIITVNEAPGLSVLDADTFCLFSDYILDADITGISQASYSWRLDGPTGTILSWDEDAIVSPLVNTTYYVVASVAFGQNFCTTVDSLELFVDGLPIAVDDGCFDLFEDSLLTGTTNDWLLNDDLSAVITGNVGFEVLNGGSVLDPASTIVIDNVTDTYVYTPFPDMSGVDSATIVIFNEACPDLRDTFVVCFNVIPVTDDPIVAMPDTFNIVAGTTVTFPILDNDTLNGQAVDTVITILLDPIYGSIDTPIVDGQVVYNSETEFASVDSFQYIVCQYLVDGEELCDTTTVIVLVDGELYIPEGFTPNADGTNDVFEIPNIELLYPNATLQIYNRWGDEVWNSQGSYMNNWDGTNFDGSQLVDGTYFYIVKLNNGSGRSMASYVVIYR